MASFAKQMKKQKTVATMSNIRTTPMTAADYQEVRELVAERTAAMEATPAIDLHEMNLRNAMQNLPSSLR